jgi:hypothetical protein
MKEFFQGLLAMIGALIVTPIQLPLGFIYSIGYSIWLTVSLKDPLAFFKFWIRFIDGMLCAVGHLFYNIGFMLDLSWNVNGEIIEDLITHEENTTFSEKDITVSASIGKIEIEGKLNNTGKVFSKVLNFAFFQKNHCEAAWKYTVARKKLKKDLFISK